MNIAHQAENKSAENAIKTSVKYKNSSILLKYSLLILIVGCSAKQPTNYDECILYNVKVGMSDYTVRSIEISCDNLFQEEFQVSRTEIRELTKEEIGNITGRGGLRSTTSDLYRSHIYNGNRALVITSVELEITTIENNADSVSRTYIAKNLSIAPFEIQSSDIRILRGSPSSKYSVKIQRASGRDILNDSGSE